MNASSYTLPREDGEYLDANYASRWNKVSEGNSKHGLVISGFPVPNGYQVRESDLMLLIPSGYPGIPLDMFYFRPGLTRSDGAPIVALVDETHFGQSWQRWSRHYQWEPGRDSIIGHIEHVVILLATEATQ